MPSRLQIDYKDNPDISEVLSGLAPGSKFTLEVELTATLNDSNGITADIDTIYVDKSEDSKTPEEDSESNHAETKPTGSKPVSLVMLGKKDSSNDSDYAES